MLNRLSNHGVSILKECKCISRVRVVAAILLWTICASPLMHGQASTPVSLGTATFYPRLARLAHGSSSVNGWIVASTNGKIFRSTDHGKTFTYIDTVPVVNAVNEYCCATLFELPQAVGSLAAGTLIFAATYNVSNGNADSSFIGVYASTDQGTTWSYLATPVQRASGTGGIWEPQFDVASDGALVMFWSDTTDSRWSQRLAQSRSYDGSTWVNQTNTVASSVQSDRPGMAVVTKLPSGTYFMTYEVCGTPACAVYYRTSQDGWNFGTVTNLGTKIQTPSGQYFEHAPTNVWSPSVLSTSGAVLVVGQVMYEANGTVSSGNGQTIFVNTSSDLSGTWYTITAPVAVPNAVNNYCPNYSSALLPSSDGNSILELASEHTTPTDLTSPCQTYYATETWNQLPYDGSTYILQNVGAQTQGANLCLDDLGWGTSNGTVADLWTCTGSTIQNWSVHSHSNGYFSIKNQVTSLCLDNTGGSSTPGNQVTLWGCAGNSNQNWQFLDTGNGQFRLRNQAGGINLDNPGDSTTPGTQLQVWTDNGLHPQDWIATLVPPAIVDGATYTFTNETSKLDLDNDCDGCTGSPTNGVAVIQYPANGTAMQQWTLHAQGGGYFTMVNAANGLCLDDPYGNGTPSRTLPQSAGVSTMLWQHSCNGTAPQNWLFIPQTDGSFVIQNQAATTNNSNQSMVIDDYDGNTSKNLQMWLTLSNGLATQRWVLTRQ
ncbi:MAG: RICIN domain-containing protein [Amaricoccus sp.]|uniref:RICIN domain-containing protein n=1 Tax=Amaricoccus sp. TaxID=1872485 RepID=UPI0039E44CEB